MSRSETESAIQLAGDADDGGIGHLLVRGVLGRSARGIPADAPHLGDSISGPNESLRGESDWDVPVAVDWPDKACVPGAASRTV